MKHTFAENRTKYVVTSEITDMFGKEMVLTAKPIPPEWRVFGKPIRYRKEDGFMGPTRTWDADYADGIRRTIVLKLWWPLRVLAGLRL